MITRRCHHRTYLLRPCPRTNQIVRYVLACMLRAYGIKLHSVIAMSDHWHLVLTDPEGRIVEFQRDCHHFIAKALNAAFDESESLWNSSQTHHLECVEPDDLIDRIGYTLANPVRAGAVMYGERWPGVRGAWPSKPRRIRRPPGFFRGEDDGGRWPEEVELVFSRPPGFEHLSDEQLAARIEDAVERYEKEARERRAAEGRGFQGRRAVRKMSRHARARSEEARGGVRPRVACRNPRLRRERLEFLRRWLQAYFEARQRWLAGEREVLFPAGTYQLRVYHGAACVPDSG